MNLKQKAMQEKLAAIKNPAKTTNANGAAKTPNKAAKPAARTTQRNLPRRGNI